MELEQGTARRPFLERLAGIDAALGASGAAGLPDVALVRRHFRRDGVGLAIGVIGAAVAFGALRWTPIAGDEHAALMVLLVALGFIGLALVALVGLAGAWLESFSVTRLVVLQSRLDVAEANEVAVASADGLAALREIRTWTAPMAQTTLTDAVVAYACAHNEGVAYSDLRVHYVKVVAIAKNAAPDEAAAERVLRALRPSGVNWPTTVAVVGQSGQT